MTEEKNILECPACGFGRCEDRGKIAASLDADFSPKDARIGSGRLYECGQCGLFFRRPVLSQDQYTELYKGLDTHRWMEDGLRPDWDHLLGLVRKHSPGKRALDVGAFTGGFLSRLGTEWDRSVIEPNPSAQEKCREKGLKVIGSVVKDIKKAENFDVICLLDLLEHLVRPLDFLKELKPALSSEGVLVIYTGTTDAFSWRVQKADSWYARYLEHNSFMNKKWFRWAAEQLGMEILDYRTFCHFNFSAKARVHQALTGLFYEWNKSIKGPNPLKWLYPFNRVDKWQEPPVWNSLKDHCALVLRRRKGQ